MSLDFVAVAEIFMTPTASMADIVFPVAHQYEMNDIGHYGIGHGMILARPKVVEPPEECWPDIKIMNELGKRVSPPEYWHDDFEAFLEDVVRPAGLSYQLNSSPKAISRDLIVSSCTRRRVSARRRGRWN